jgi:hypothetical protein
MIGITANVFYINFIHLTNINFKQDEEINYL